MFSRTLPALLAGLLWALPPAASSQETMYVTDKLFLGLYDNAVLSTEVTSLVWEAETCRWVIRTDRGDETRAWASLRRVERMPTDDAANARHDGTGSTGANLGASLGSFWEVMFSA